MVKVSIVPRITETDGLGHISNTTIPIWLEHSRRELFENFNGDLSFMNFRLLLVNTNINYRKEIFVDSVVEVESFVKEYGNTSVKFKETIKQYNQVCVEAETIYVNIDTKTHKKKLLSDADKEILNRFKEGI